MESFRLYHELCLVEESSKRCCQHTQCLFSLFCLHYWAADPASSKHSQTCFGLCLIHSLLLSYWLEDTDIDGDCCLVTWRRLKWPMLVQPALFSLLSHMHKDRAVVSSGPRILRLYMYSLVLKMVKTKVWEGAVLQWWLNHVLICRQCIHIIVKCTPGEAITT